MDKKAQESFTILQIIPRLIFLVIVLFSIVFLVRIYVVDSLNVQDVQAEVFMNRIIYSPNGISYYDDDTKMILPGVINPKLLTDDRLNSLMNYGDDNFIAGEVQLLNKNNEKITSAAYNKKTYERWGKLVGQMGKGGAKAFQKSIFVIYIDENNKMNAGILKFDVLLPGN